MSTDEPHVVIANGDDIQQVIIQNSLSVQAVTLWL